MNKIIKGQIITLILYCIIYLIISFVIWDFYNPFQWIIDIPDYKTEERAGILTGFVVYYAILYGVIKDFSTYNNKIN